MTILLDAAIRCVVSINIQLEVQQLVHSKGPQEHQESIPYTSKTMNCSDNTDWIHPSMMFTQNSGPTNKNVTNSLPTEIKLSRT